MAVAKLGRMTHSVTGGIRRPLAWIGLFWPALHVMASTGWPVRPDQVPFVFLLAGNGRPMMPMVPVVLAVFSAWLAWLEPMAGGLCLCVPAGRSFGYGILWRPLESR